MKHLYFAAFFLLVGCSEKATQLVVSVSSDYRVPEELASFRAVILADTGELASERTFLLAGSSSVARHFTLPLSFGVGYRKGSGDQPVVIEIEARGPEAKVLSVRRVRTHFIEGKTLLLPIVIARGCADVVCGSGNTCSEKGCVPERIAPETLREIEPGDEVVVADAGVVEPQEDAGIIEPIDAGTLDAETLPDATTPADAGAPDTGIAPLPIRIYYEGLLFSSEAEDTARFQLVLVEQPTAVVNIEVTVTAPGEAFAETDKFEIKPDGEWFGPADVSIKGRDDLLADGDVTYQAIISLHSDDLRYNGVTTQVSIVNIDNEPSSPGFRIYPAQDVVVSEDGSEAFFAVRMLSPPEAVVIVGMSASDSSEIGMQQPMLYFTPVNWFQPQQVVVWGVNDTLYDGDQRVFVATTCTTEDKTYEEWDPDEVWVLNRDNDPIQ